MAGVVQTWPLTLLRVEGVAIFGSTIWAYSRLALSWWTFGTFLLLPDIGMAGFAANTRLGSATYNSVHTETPPILLLCYGLAQNNKPVMGAALTWLAHIAMDRMLGFGLKYDDGFGVTHMGVIGGKEAAEVKKE